MRPTLYLLLVMTAACHSDAPSPNHPKAATTLKEQASALKDSAAVYNDEVALHYMEVALQMGCLHPEDFLRDPRFARIRSSRLFAPLYYNTICGGSQDPDKTRWTLFKSQFRELSLPLVVDTVWLRNNLLPGMLGVAYERFVPEIRGNKFGLQGQTDVYFVGSVKKDTAGSVLLYAFYDQDDENEMIPVMELVSYDKDGRIIDKMRVAGDSPSSRIFTLQPDLGFEVRSAQERKVYHIAANGKFKKVGTP